MHRVVQWRRSTSQANGDGTRNEGRLAFTWEAAVVYDGVVYDHVHYRLRGANGRYHPGKRSFRIRFNEGNLLDARDQDGKKFPTQWRELTTGKGQANRGSEFFALNEMVNCFLFNKVDVPAQSTFYFHFRVIRGASETGADQYSGDFWGLNWAQEKYDVNFLNAHGLPKGNFYKLVDNFVLGVDERRYQGAYAPTNAEDFFNIQNNLNGFKSTDWLLAHVNYTNWYRYNAICEAIRQYDFWPSANKNGAWYFEPIYTAANNYLGRLMTFPYDTTDTWGPTWNTGYDICYNGIFNVFNPPAPAGAPINTTGGDAGDNPGLQLEYRNVVREIRDLLFQPDQIGPIIDGYASIIRPFAPADIARWLNAPSPASYNSLFIPGTPGVTGGVAGVVQDMKNFMFTG
ncbi:MAG TPA: CotH kinase family protein, partial [Candidatus Dormibacteraeota bacterium]|nr:CotH kinase family protein [Candidatus Dormibacteraeota bacterium]